MNSSCQPQTAQELFLWLLLLYTKTFDQSVHVYPGVSYALLVYHIQHVDRKCINYLLSIIWAYMSMHNAFLCGVASVSFPDLHYEWSGNETMTWHDQVLSVGVTQVLQRSCSTCAMSTPTTRGRRSKCGRSRTLSSSSVR